jgi:hypothetical protein
VDRFQELGSELNKLRKILQQEKKEQTGDPAVLYYVHHKLFRLEEFRDFTVYQTRSASLDVNRTLDLCFQRLAQVSLEFAEFLWETCSNIFELVKRSQYSSIVAIVKIIEKEEATDEEALSLGYPGQEDEDNPTLTKSIDKRAAQKHPREIKSYRSKFFQIMHDLIATRFNDRIEPLIEDKEETLIAAKFIFEDLTLVCDKLAPRVPKKYKIFPFFVLGYHRLIYDLINRVSDPPVDISLILAIFQWVREYHSSMQSELGISEELLEPKLLEMKDKLLVVEYLKLVKAKLQEWQSNLMSTEVKEFVDRTNSPETDAGGMYGLSAAVLLFQMLNQQIDVAMDSQNEAILLGVVRECKNAIDEFQKDWLRHLDSEYKKQFDSPDKCAPGLVEYTIALANDNLKALEFTESLIERLRNTIQPEPMAQLNEGLNRSMDGFMDVAKKCYQYLIEVSFMDVKAAFGTMFTEEWYRTSMMPSIVLTLQDYCDDYNSHLHQYLFTKMISDIMDRFMLCYLEAMRVKGVKLRVPECGERMTKDIESGLNLFSSFKSRKRIEGKFQALEFVRLFVVSSPKFAFMEFYTLWKAFPDVPLSFIEDIIYRRTDLDKASCKEIMETIKQKCQEQQAQSNNAEQPRTFFSKMAGK